MKNIAIFASGSGTNAENLIQFFNHSNTARVVLVLTNNKHAKVIQRAKKLNVDTHIFDHTAFYEGNEVLDTLKKYDVDWLVLAGFLWLVPSQYITAYPGRIINIHPALLPNYGGKGMFGMHVHEAVVRAGDTQSGITIHYVNENFDEGEIIAQHYCNLSPDDTPEELAQKVHALEYEFFPSAVETCIVQADTTR